MLRGRVDQVRLADGVPVAPEGTHYLYWDSTIVTAVLSADVPILYSEDMQCGLIIEGKVQIRNPFI